MKQSTEITKNPNIADRITRPLVLVRDMGSRLLDKACEAIAGLDGEIEQENRQAARSPQLPK